MKNFETLVKLDEMLWCAENGIKPEEEPDMKDIPGFEGKYAITRDGQVWSYWANGFIADSDNGQGYRFITLWKDNKAHKRRIHRLVAEAFIPVPASYPTGVKLDVGHKDDNPSNNHYTNLYWCSRAENLDTDHFREAQKNKIYSKVRCVETGEIYPSIKAAGEAIGKHKYGVNLCLLGKQQTCGGFHWERVFD